MYEKFRNSNRQLPGYQSAFRSLQIWSRDTGNPRCVRQDSTLGRNQDADNVFLQEEAGLQRLPGC